MKNYKIALKKSAFHFKALHLLGVARLVGIIIVSTMVIGGILDSMFFFRGLQLENWAVANIHPMLPLMGLLLAGLLLYSTHKQRLPWFMYAIPIGWMISEGALLYLVFFNSL